MVKKLGNIRVAIISSSFPPYGEGGVTSAHYHLYNALKSSGLIVQAFTFLDCLKSSRKEQGVTRSGGPKLLIKAFGLMPQLYFRLQNYNQHSYQVADIFQSAPGAWRLNYHLRMFKPQVVILPDHGCPALYIKKASYMHFILISHHNPARFLNNPLIGLHSEADTRLAVKIENLTMKKIDHVICPSFYMKDCFKKTYQYRGPIAVIPNLIDNYFIEKNKPVNLAEMLGLPAKSLIIYIPSAGSVFKGSYFVPEIIRRLSISHGKKLGFYLSGNLNEELKYRLLSMPGNAKICAPGYVNYQKNISLIKACSFGISPTLIESFGMAILEANFCGLPMVCFNGGGNKDIIADRENGFLVKPLDIETLITYSEKLLNGKILSVMREKTLKYTKNNFDSKLISQKYLKIIRQVL